MHILRTTSLVLLLLLISTLAAAQCPNLNGAWATYNGTMLGGRASEAWCGVDGAPLQPGMPGNTQNAMSWNGSALGTEWKAFGMAIDANGATLIDDSLDGFGNGSRTYSTDYVGGEFWMTKNNTWSDGVADLSGQLTSYQVVATITFFGGVPVGLTSNITFSGTFDNCPQLNGCEIRFSIANAMKVWDSGMASSMPADYPAFLCGANGGELFDICCALVDVNCIVDNESASWGTLKAMFK
ncbi:hypothetical protein KJ682_10265 [bacterium]|nr:hypothetical protein [bacterium]